MAGGGGGPEAEAVMVLAGEDDAAHGGIGEGREEGISIEAGGLEEVGVFVAVTPFLVCPFLVCECVDGEVEEGGGFERMPAELGGGGDGAIGTCGDRNRGGGGQQAASGEHVL
jgi:hypothetical protein